MDPLEERALRCQAVTSEAGLVSVIMPVFNGEAFVGQAIRSVLCQEYPDWELVVIDDGSTDDTATIVGAIGDTRIRYVHQDNRGQAAALNRGLRVARGEFVTTVDADDCLTPNSLADRVTYLQRNPDDDAVYGDGFYCDALGEPVRRFSEVRPPGIYVGDLYPVLVWTSFFGTGAPVMIRKAALRRRDLWYDESIIWCQDWDFYLRLAENARFGMVPSITVHYRLHDANMTRSVAQGRRVDALVSTQVKAIRSARFATLPAQTKRTVFCNVLTRDLCGSPDRQTAILGEAAFQLLPRAERARILRLMASEYLIRREQPSVAAGWLRQAWRLNPRDPKAAALAGVALVHAGAAGWLASTWRAAQRQRTVWSAFEQVRRAA